MIIYSIVTMKDLMRQYRLLLKRRNESDSESESQPLMNSSCSSTKSFGTVTGSPIFNQDQESYSENEDTFKYSVSPNSPIIIKTPSNKKLGISQKNIFSKEKPKYEQLEQYTTIGGFIDPPLVNKSTTLDSFIDYKIIEEVPTNSSLVTIFATWNTTMGTSLLAMSWGLEKTGLFPGIAINIIVAAICLYTAYVLLNVNQKHSMLGQNNEAFDLCRMLIGKWAEVLAKIFSIIVLIGSNIVYWILMANFLYNSVDFIYGSFASPESASNDSLSVICLKNLAVESKNTTNFVGNPPNDSLYNKVWDLYSTVPIFLGIIMFPVLNFKSATFFTKFNSLGTISVLYILIFVAIKSYNWGINIPDWSVEFQLKPTFCALSGMLSLSYFIHNIIISIMRNNRHQENNGRDLSIAFCLITFTYLFIGVTFYICFPLAKSCIEDNILNNFSRHDVLTVIARVLLLFQLFTVFPLITYMLRMDILTNINMIFKNYRFGDFTYGRVIIINSVILFICIMFACFLPRIGTLIRYTGALSGLVYVFLLPSLLKIASLKKEDNLTICKLIFHVVIIVLGVVNLFSQFFINDN